ncbi:unnamed protein product [Symbiodinium sp. CCMP2456]|nr:unnamed protein product [Symbiodinium sp. CCMP2456]
MDFTAEFNREVDAIREDKRCGGLNADLLNKDKTRMLQFIAPLDVFEKVICFLLRRAGMGIDDASHAGEDMVRLIASIDTDELLQSFKPSLVCPLATQNSIDGAVALTKWFRRIQHLSFNAPAEIQKFRNARQDMVQPVPQPTMDTAVALLAECSMATFDPVAFLEASAKDKAHLLRFAQDPFSSVAEVKTRLFELLLLCFLGFIAISDSGRWSLIQYAADDEEFLKAVERLQVWMEDLSIPRLRACVPTTAGAVCLLDQKQADAFCKALKAMAYDGAAEPTTDKSPFLRQAQAMDIPLTQPPASSGQCANPDLPSSEQTSTANAEAAEGQPPPKKLRGEAPLVASMFSESFIAVKAATKSHFCAQAATVEQWRVNAFFKRTFPQASSDLLLNVPRWWVAAGLAERDPNQKVSTKVILKAPPPDMLETVADALADVFSFTKEERTSLLRIWDTRDVSTTFSKDDFDSMCRLLR